MICSISAPLSSRITMLGDFIEWLFVTLGKSFWGRGICFCFYLFFLMARYIMRSKIEPPTAMSRLRISKPVTLPNPKVEPINPPTKAPAIPKMIVMKTPPGSLPGIKNLAIIPTISPSIIHERIHILTSFAVLKHKISILIKI